MSKRKRIVDPREVDAQPAKAPKISSAYDILHLQIVTGSYERVLHGITAAIPTSLLSSKQDTSSTDKPSISFADSFLLHAHTSAIRCIAVSPSPPSSAPSQKVILATGSTDEKINLFHLSTRVPRGPVLPALGTKTQENSSNRSLGTLYTHDAAVTALHFPNRSKLLSSCGNNVIAITSTKTFNTLSLIKAPNPKHPNRPTGDTSTSSTLPNGVNDFAVHPSMKLMISVGRAEKNMRLWNLVTGRKAGVLAFDRDMLNAVSEGTRWGSGEGRRVLWSPDGDEFAIVFEKGICIFGMDCNPRATIAPSPRTKLHQVHYVSGAKSSVLAVSTEDGRILFYATADFHSGEEDEESLLECVQIGQLGGKPGDTIGRIKDFQITALLSGDSSTEIESLLITTAGSDGILRLWNITLDELARSQPRKKTSKTQERTTNGVLGNGTATNSEPRQIGRLIGTYETSNRITCLVSFLLSGKAEDAGMAVLASEDGSNDDDDENDDDDDSEVDSDEAQLEDSDDGQ